MSQVPAGVRFCTVKTNEPMDTDVGCILLCPQNSEADYALDLLKKVFIFIYIHPLTKLYLYTCTAVDLLKKVL